MKNRFVVLIVAAFLLCLSSMTLKAQTTTDPDSLEKEIITLEEKNIDDMSSSVKKIYKENLLFMYEEYVSLLNRQIDLLENIPDPRGEFARKRTEYTGKRAKTLDKIGFVKRNLDIQNARRPERVVDAPKEAPKEEAPREAPKEEKNTLSKEKKNPLEKPVASTDTQDDKPVTSSKPQVDSKTNTFFDDTPVIKSEAEKIAKGVIDNLRNDEDVRFTTDDRYAFLFALTVARSIETEANTEAAIINLEPLRFLPETARTDKQIGASSSTAASTSAIDKPGFASLLGFAIENGYVEENVQDTVLTLTTSPAAFFTLSEDNFTDAYNKSGFLNRIGLSASFNINSDTPVLENVNRSQLREYSVRYRFFGDRSPRSPKLQKIWDTSIAPEVRKLLVARGQINEFIDNTELLMKFRNETNAQFDEEVLKLTKSASFKALTPDKQEAELVNLTLNFVKAAVLDRLNNQQTDLDESVKTQLRNKMGQLLVVQKNLAFKEIEKRLDEFFEGPLGTVAYINHRDPLGNFSEFKVIYEQENVGLFKPFSKMTFNGGFSFYHKPNAMMNQKRIRDFSFALSFEGKKLSPFRESGDFSYITYSFTGRYERLLENQTLANRKADLLKAQFLLNFPVIRGLIIPFSVTYSNATELEKKQGVRVNFGLKFDTEKLLEINRISRFF